MAPRIGRFFARSSSSKDSKKALLTPPVFAPSPGPSSAYAHDTGSSISMSTFSTPRPTQYDTRRESYLEWLRDRYPTFQPQNDYEIVSIVESNYDGPESELRRLMDKQLLLDIMFAMGLESLEDVARMDTAVVAHTAERFIWHAKTILDAPGKPEPGTANVFYRQIPNSPCFMRLFPGLLAQNEWYMDFVDGWTGEPVNSGFQIYSPRDSGAMPWLGGSVTLVRPLEGFSGGAEIHAGAGAETFILRDGQTCLLRRQGHKDVLFKVPVRALGLDLANAQVDQLHFPELV